MKKLLILLLLIFAGCNESDVKPLDQHILSAPPAWQEAYGDTPQTQLYFNMVVMQAEYVKIRQKIDALETPEN